MVKVLIPGGSESPCWDRLKRIGREGKPIEDGRIPQLDGDSADWVCLVPAEVFEGGTWARLRVKALGEVLGIEDLSAHDCRHH